MIIFIYSGSTERLAVRYQLASVLMGNMPRLGLTTADASSARTAAKQSFGRRLQNTTAAALLERLDPAPGVEISEIERRTGSLDPEARINETIRQILATRQYQLA